MADTYTSNLHLVLQATGDTNWGVTVNTMLSYLDGLAPIGGLNVTPFDEPVSTSLHVTVSAGSFILLSTGAS